MEYLQWYNHKKNQVSSYLIIKPLPPAPIPGKLFMKLSKFGITLKRLNDNLHNHFQSRVTTLEREEKYSKRLL